MLKKVKQSRYTPWRRLGGEEYSSYSFSTSALDGGEWSASRPGRSFTPGERSPGIHCTEGWVGPRAGLDTEVTGKILCPCRESNPDRPVVQPVVRHYTALANPVPSRLCYCIDVGKNLTDISNANFEYLDSLCLWCGDSHCTGRHWSCYVKPQHAISFLHLRSTFSVLRLQCT
jgi:hypothetical protein